MGTIVKILAVIAFYVLLCWSMMVVLNGPGQSIRHEGMWMIGVTLALLVLMGFAAAFLVKFLKGK